MYRKIFTTVVALFLMQMFSLSAHTTINTSNCEVRNSNDDPEINLGFNQLRTQLENFSYRSLGTPIRLCTEKITFSSNYPEQQPGIYNIQLQAPLDIKYPEDIDYDGDGYGLVIDGVSEKNVEIHAEHLTPAEGTCIINIHALRTDANDPKKTNKVKITQLTLHVKKASQAICGGSGHDINISIVEHDPDGDGVDKDIDNCPTIANSDQKDSDGDKVGDACEVVQTGDPVPGPEPEPGIPVPPPVHTGDPVPGPEPEPGIPVPPPPRPPDQPETPIDVNPNINPNDPDGDGLLSENDNCDLIANPDQANTDGDDLGDACDPNPNAANSTSDGTVVDINSGGAGGCSLNQREETHQAATLGLMFLLPVFFWVRRIFRW